MARPQSSTSSESAAMASLPSFPSSLTSGNTARVDDGAAASGIYPTKADRDRDRHRIERRQRETAKAEWEEREGCHSNRVEELCIARQRRPRLCRRHLQAHTQQASSAQRPRATAAAGQAVGRQKLLRSEEGAETEEAMGTAGRETAASKRVEALV